MTAVRRPALRLLLLGYFGYCLARKASRLALVVYAFDVGGVHTASIVAAAQLIPAIVAPPVGSVFGDRMSSESALTLGYVLQAVALVGTGLSMMRDGPLAVTVLLATVSAASALQLAGLEREVFPNTLTGIDHAHRATTRTVEDHLDADRLRPPDDGSGPSRT